MVLNWPDIQNGPLSYSTANASLTAPESNWWSLNGIDLLCIYEFLFQFLLVRAFVFLTTRVILPVTNLRALTYNCAIFHSIPSPPCRPFLVISSILLQLHPSPTFVVPPVPTTIKGENSGYCPSP